MEKEEVPPNTSISWSVIKELIKTYKKPLLLAALAGILILIFIPIITYFIFAQDMSDKDRIINRNKGGLTLLDRTGDVFFTFNQPKSVQYVSLADIPKSIQDAVVANEDRDFYENPGFSIKGILRAVRENIASGDIVQGGSTISQELVKNALLNSQVNFLRKYQELTLAIELNRRYSKQDILEMYLNSVYYGEGAYGIENAAQTYFGIPAKELTLAQSALLVGILPAPSARSPLSNNPDIAKRNQERVLDTMMNLGYITQEQAVAAKNAPLHYEALKENPINNIAPHFALMVKDELTKKYGEDAVLRSGFRVTTTLNKKWQEYAETAVKNQVKALAYQDVSNGAAVAIDPKTGEIEVLVGSYDWADEKFGKVNMVTAERQPGSSFKPIIYTKALEDRLITASTILEDKEITFPGGYKPRNYDNRFRGPVTVRRALANSLNIPALEVMEKVGVQSGVDFAKELGISTLDSNKDYGLPLALGAAEVQLLDITNAYATFANGGKLNTPTTIIEVKNKYNEVIYTYQPDPHQVVSEIASYIITSILSDNSARAETFGGLLTISRTAAVKTGTTEDYRDSLTIGYTPNLAVGAWVGNNDNTPMKSVAGSTGAAPIWRNLMNYFFRDLPNEKFPKPSSLVEKNVCPFKNFPDAKYASSGAYMEFFMPGSQPKNECEDPTPTPGPTATPNPTDSPTSTPQPTVTPAPTTAQPSVVPTNQPTPTSIVVQIP